MNLFSKWIELKNDNHKEPYSTLITNSEIQRLLENKAMEVNPEEKRMMIKTDVLIISFARKIADFPLIIRNTFYKKFMYTNKNPYQLIWLYCDLFFKFFVFYYNVSFPAKWDLDDNKTMELLKLFFDFCILIMTKKQFELILKLFKDYNFLKFNCLSDKLSQYSFRNLTTKETDIIPFYTVNEAYKLIVRNYKPIFQNHKLKSMIYEKIDGFLLN